MAVAKTNREGGGADWHVERSSLSASWHQRRRTMRSSRGRRLSGLDQPGQRLVNLTWPGGRMAREERSRVQAEENVWRVSWRCRDVFRIVRLVVS